MTVYISGKISGLDYKEVEAKFRGAEDLLDYLGFTVVNPLDNGLTVYHSWNEHMVQDIEMLLPCQAIYMLDNWIDSVGAGIEYDIAVRMRKDIWFESNVVNLHEMISKIQDAIHEATGLKFSEYTSKSRNGMLFYCRMIFAHHCRKLNMTLKAIATLVKRDHSSMAYVLKKYEDEVKYNPEFRAIAEKVNKILNNKPLNIDVSL